MVVIDDKDRILLIQREQTATTGGGDWAIPGGKIDPGERLAIAAVRETEEEVGITINSCDPLSAITEDLAWGPENHFVTHYFATRDWIGTPSVMEPLKHLAVRWATLDEIVAAHRGEGDMPLFEPLDALLIAGGLHQALGLAMEEPR